MTIESEIAAKLQSFDVGDYVEFYEIDLTPIGGQIMRITPFSQNQQPTLFGGHVYSPLNCESDGFEYSTEEQDPRPSFRLYLMGDTGGVIRNLIRDYSDLVGMRFTRIRTLREFIDTNQNVRMPSDIYMIERKVSQNKVMVEWELSGWADVLGIYIPGRQVIRDVCLHYYRIWIDGAFDYSQVTCPYTAARYWKEDGTVTSVPSEDKCGKRLSDCRLRFSPGNLPTRAFPGVSRVRVT